MNILRIIIHIPLIFALIIAYNLIMEESKKCNLNFIFTPFIADADRIEYRTFKDEQDLQTIISMIEKELSEPYPIYTYRYFVQKWPQHTFLAFLDGKCIGCIVSKLEDNVKQYWRTVKRRGYIAMLAVHPDYRRLGLGRKLVKKSID